MANNDFQIFVAQSRDALHLKQALFLVEGTTAIASIRAAGAAKRALLMGRETLPMSDLATGALTANGYSVSRGGQEYLRGTFTARFRRNEVEISASAEVSIPVVALVAFALVSGGMSAS